VRYGLLRWGVLVCGLAGQERHGVLRSASVGAGVVRQDRYVEAW
jgi:hypothetical protein